MAEKFLQGVELAVMRVTDEHSDEDLLVKNPRELGAGFYDFGVMIDGAFVSLIELKGGDVEARVAAYKKANPPEAEQPAGDEQPTE